MHCNHPDKLDLIIWINNKHLFLYSFINKQALQHMISNVS